MLQELKGWVRNTAIANPLLLPVFIRLRGGVEARRVRINDREYRFVAGRYNYTGTTGVDRDGVYEGPFLKRLAESLSAAKDPVFFDIGSNVGLDAMVAADHGAHRIHLFEPDPLALYYLRKNLPNHSFRVNEQFVGDLDSATTITIDTYCRAHSIAPTHIKMDVEGHEIHCLRGMRQVLRAHRPALFIEFHERIIRSEIADAERAIADFHATLDEAGYRVEYNGHHCAMHLSADHRYDYTWLDSKPPVDSYAIHAYPR